jgi:hypothetical protein
MEHAGVIQTGPRRTSKRQATAVGMLGYTAIASKMYALGFTPLPVA